MRCIAIDDEPLALSLIEGYFSNHKNIELTTYTNPILGIEKIKEQRPELALLDIEMKEHSGLDLARELPEECLLIFTTAHAKYALDGYDLRAVDFLHKPFTYERFAAAIARAEHITEIHSRASKAGRIDSSSITIKVDYQNVTIQYADIIYVEALANYVKIHCMGGRKILTKMSVKSFLEMLPEAEFLRIHRSFVIAKSQVLSFTKQYVKLRDANGTTIPIGRNFADKLYTVLINTTINTSAE
ncbi:MAG: LytTR family DNA-binding domain-containing protein [Rikenellaceae bacterium]